MTKRVGRSQQYPSALGHRVGSSFQVHLGFKDEQVALFIVPHEPNDSGADLDFAIVIEANVPGVSIQQ
ncbi:hypothetical protein D3C76_1691330 [compost metagenome]